MADRTDQEFEKFVADSDGNVAVNVQFVTKGTAAQTAAINSNVNDREADKFNSSGAVRMVAS